MDDESRAHGSGQGHEGLVALDGEVVGGRMYLVDKRRGVVYDGEVGAEGLMRVGRWVDGAVVEDPPAPAPASAPASARAPAEGGKEAEREERPVHPFEVDDADHCETGVESYADVVPVLDLVCARVGRTRATLRIYDPYYCDGAVVRNLGRYGFTAVRNECEDFYECVARGRVPEHDVVVTNPPYSGDHVSRLLAWCVSGRKPAFLLLPNHFYAKPYFARTLKEDACWFLCPTRRYCYWAPVGMRAKGHAHRNAGRGERTSPFVSLWFLLFGESEEGGGGAGLREAVAGAWAAGGALARDMKAARTELKDVAARARGTRDEFPVDVTALDTQYTVLARGVRDLPLGCRADEDPLKQQSSRAKGGGHHKKRR